MKIPRNVGWRMRCFHPHDPLACAAVGLWLLNSALAETQGVPPPLLAFQGITWLLWVTALWLRWVGCGSPPGAGNAGWGRRGFVVGAGVLAGLAVLLAGRGAPTEHLLGVQDESYNLSTALALARTGHPHAAVDADAGSPVAPAWIHRRPTQAQRAADPSAVGATRRAYGFLFFEDGSDTRVRSVFPTGFSMLAAGIGGLFGEPGVFWANTLMLLGLAPAGGLLASRLTTRVGGIATTVLILLCPLHLWISRTGFAEPMLAFLFVYGLWILSETGESPRPLLLALIFGALPLVKFEGLLGAAAGGAAACAVLRGRPRELLRFSAAFVAMGGLAILLLGRGGGGYTLDTLRTLLGSDGWRWAAGAAAVCLAVAAMFPRLRKSKALRARILEVWQRRRGTIRSGFIVFAALAFAWLLWGRPVVHSGDSFYYWPLGREILSWREVTLPRLAWYFSLPGLVIGFAGLITLPWSRRAGPASAVLLLVFGVSFFFLAWDIRNNPTQPYAMRRLVGFGTPLLCFGIAALPARLPEQLHRWIAPLQTLLAVIFGATFLSLAAPLLPEGERRGIYSKLAEIRASLPDEAPVLIPAEGPAHRMILPLLLGFQAPLVPVAPARSEASLLEDFRHEPPNGAAPVFLISSQRAEKPPLASFYVEETFLRQSATTRPFATVTRGFEIHLLAPAADTNEETDAPSTFRRRRQLR